MLILIIILLLLGTTPISIIYNIKNDNIGNTVTYTTNVYCLFVFYMYSISSYVYSIKPLMFFFNKKFSYCKYKSNDQIRYKYYNYLCGLLFIYIIIILITLMCLYFNKNTTTQLIELNFILTPILILIYCVYFNKYNYQFVLI